LAIAADAGDDISPEPDAQVDADAGRGQHATDASSEAPPLPFDAGSLPDAPGCTSSGPTSIYVVTESANLLRFDPASATFQAIGPLIYTFIITSVPSSMAVDRTNTAYVAHLDGTIARVDTQTGVSTATAYSGPFTSFGMGFVRDPGGMSETLYIAPNNGLAAVDMTTWRTMFVGTWSLGLSELSGSPDGRLFAFVGSTVSQVDPSTAGVLATIAVVHLDVGAGWAFAYWGGDFYLFTAPNGSSIVTRFRPSDGSLVQVASLSQIIVGAGVSTCAP
jgi:outer membrane protein assembly factor BamB